MDRGLALASIYAQNSIMPRGRRHGSVVMLHGKFIAGGYNTYRNYSKDKIIDKCCSCHAEIDAIRNTIKIMKITDPIKQKRLFQKTVLYVVRLNDQDEFLDSSPCCVCHSKLMEFGIRRIVYSLDRNYVSVKVKDYIPKNGSTGYDHYSSVYKSGPLKINY